MPGQPGSAASGSGVPAGVGSAVTTGLGVGPVGGSLGAGVATGEGTSDGALDAGATDGAVDGAPLATAACLPCAATGSWSPPRAATKVIAIAAQATVNSADASTAGVSVRPRAARVEPSTP